MFIVSLKYYICKYKKILLNYSVEYQNLFFNLNLPSNVGDRDSFSWG